MEKTEVSSENNFAVDEGYDLDHLCILARRFVLK